MPIAELSAAMGSGRMAGTTRALDAYMAVRVNPVMEF
jgi:hypothetical protein